MNENNQLIVKVSRDSVCAGDDVEDHRAVFFVEKSGTLTELIGLAIKACPLASIYGGKATWIICLPKKEFRNIGVLAQEWSAPKLIVAGETNAEEYFGSQEICIDFKYWCQANPIEVYAAVNSGTELPSKYGRNEVSTKEGGTKKSFFSAFLKIMFFGLLGLIILCTFLFWLGQSGATT